MYWISILTEAGIFGVMALGLNVIWGMSGDFDLGYYGYVALSTYLTIVLTVGSPIPPVQYILGATLPYPLAVLVAVLITVMFATLVGMVALRGLRAIYFALTTLGAVSVLYVVVQTVTPLFNGFNGVSGLVDPMGTALGLGYFQYRYFLLGLCLVVLLIAAILVHRLSKSQFGRLLRAVRDDEDAVSAFGRSVYRTKLKAYVFGASLGAIAGGLFAAYLGAFNPSAWTPAEVLTLYAGVLIGGRGNVKGVIIGVFVVYIGFVELTRSLPPLPGNAEFAPALRQVLIGLLIILFLKFRPQGLIPEKLNLDDRPPRGGFLSRLRRRPHTNTPPEGHPRRRHNQCRERRMTATNALEVTDLHISFGGVKAVDGCSFYVPPSSAVGLIGPNGAGKSTAIDLISGFKSADSGSVRFRDRELVGMNPHAISRLGLIRTFQSPREWASLTVLDNVLIGMRGYRRESLGRSLFAMRRMHRAEESDRDRARALLEDFGLTRLKDLPAGSLSGGQKRLVEFARIAAAEPTIVILDEPMGGVNPVLGERIGQAVRALIDKGSSVLVVEHNLKFIEDYCDAVIVMDQGKVIAEGPYDSLRDNPLVVTAYLGDVENA